MLGAGVTTVGVAKAALMPRVSFDFTKGTLDSRITFTRASSATYFDSAGVLQTAGNNVARFDYDPSTLAARGLLIEATRTNRCLYSEDLNQADWVKGANVTATYNTTVAPDGNTTADTLTISGTDNGVYQSITVTASTTYNWSWWVKLGTLAAADFKFAIYDNTGAAFIAQDIVPTQTPTSTGWTRISYSFSTPVGCTSIRVYVLRNGTISSGTVNVWGMQLEAGAFLTSYIPTTTTALTRLADDASITGANFSDWFNSAQGTFYFEYQGIANSSGSIRRVFEIGNTGSSANRIIAGYAALTDARFSVSANSSTQASITVNGITQGNIVNACVAYAQNSFSAAANGISGTEDTAGDVPTVSAMWLGSQESKTSESVILNGHIRLIRYYPTRLPNGTAQLLTS